MNAEKEAFFRDNAELAMEEQIRYGIPASVTLIQMWFESGGGRSDVAREANNYFGVKDHAGVKAGRPVYRHDDADEKNAPFRVYDSKEASVRGHSLVLMGGKYKDCHSLSPTDYAGWLKGIKQADYASASGYDRTLIKDLEAYNLQRYDAMAVDRAGRQGVTCGYLRDAADHAVSRSSRPVSGSLRFGMPLRDGDRLVLTSDYGYRSLPGSNDHKGIDLRAARGTAVYATEDDGVVVGIGYQPANPSKGLRYGGGNYVYVAYPRKDGSYVVTGYLHLDAVSVKVGDRVTADTRIGSSGNTGGVVEHLDFRVAAVTGDSAASLRKHIADGCAGYCFSPRSDGGVFRDPKEYLAEVAVGGGLPTTLVRSDDRAGRDVLLAYREHVDQVSDDRSLARQEHHAEAVEKDRDLSIEETIARTAKSNGIFSAILGKDGSALGQMFQDGSDLTSGIIHMLMMAFLSLAFNSRSEEEMARNERQREEAKPSEQQEEYNVREKRVDVKELADMASTRFDIEWPDQSGDQQVSQQQRSGYSA